MQKRLDRTENKQTNNAVKTLGANTILTRYEQSASRPTPHSKFVLRILGLCIYIGQ